MLGKSMSKLKVLNNQIQKNKELVERGRKLYVNIARLAAQAKNNWTPEEHRSIQSQLRQTLHNTKKVEEKMKLLQSARPYHAAVAIQSAWRGYSARGPSSRKPQVPHRSNSNRRLRRSSRPQSPPKP